jgi:hypothetical protein
MYRVLPCESVRIAPRVAFCATMITTGEAAVVSAMAPVGEAAGAGVGDADKAAVGEDP